MIKIKQTLGTIHLSSKDNIAIFSIERAIVPSGQTLNEAYHFQLNQGKDYDSIITMYIALIYISILYYSQYWNSIIFSRIWRLCFE